ncbi:MAG: hypothetical protein ACREMH_06740 [Gemmatimonadales bacterium]
MTRRIPTVMATIAAAAVAAWGCNDDRTPTSPSVLASAGGVGKGGICRDEEGNPLPIAPRSARVDLEKPEFSDPTDIDNPLFPVSSQERVLLFGHVDGLSLRIEVTTLDDTRVFDLTPRPVETRISQFVALLDGRIHEVAIDHYAQADDGAVWYFGEFVFDYEDGVVVDTEGTWFAGTDGRPAMIMPANPQVGNVWRPEDICGLVFEEVSATATGVTVDGPTGPVPGALIVQELHQDGLLEEKTFAPGYGEFISASNDGDLEALALAVPTDALTGPTPAALVTLRNGAIDAHDAAESGDWTAASAALAAMTIAWNVFKAGDVPPMLEEQVDDALADLAAAIAAEDEEDARQAAIRTELGSLDLQLRYRSVGSIDLDLLELWQRQLTLDQDAGDQAGVLSDNVIIDQIEERLD